ncbi:evolutionarily conserved signaling intermediate in Toll pathway, mitochondrial-like [Saccoglossus kowalevskii]|uniref:Evolutionarily conserved signaling intermediate in Toll pathway, mitochondrial n=1 Tax=Saccoglossus kowalevskii TaxID=10224 RepID=A0ABM0MGQ2_SACKO|nr:PREDICTED: evolutionarily conserved signaling intermediate in Toll pathway, mitochondrial-like [Saccoglossus kowalevskii]
MASIINSVKKIPILYCRLLNPVLHSKFIPHLKCDISKTSALFIHQGCNLRQDHQTKEDDNRAKKYAELLQNSTNRESLIIQDNLFEDAYKKQPNKESFEHAINTFEGRDKRRRGHVQFMYTALKWMKIFGLEKDISVYNRLLHVFPKGEFIPENFIQTMFNHFPEEQACAIKILQQMEDNGLMPNEETKGVLLAVFGSKAHPMRKLQRMKYWFLKFRNINPFPVPKDLSDDPVVLAEIGLKRISEYDAKLDVFRYTNGAGHETFIAQVQSPEQKELLAEHPKYAPVYVEGSYNLWLRNKKLTYFVLRADNVSIAHDVDAEMKDEESTPVNPFPKEGPVFAICMAGDDSQESLRTWLTYLQEDNPNLGNLPVVFNIYQPPDREVTLHGSS